MSAAKDFRTGNLADDVLCLTLERGEITPKKFAERYFGWRIHALKGNTRNMVRSTDRRVNARLNQIGYQLRIVRHQGGKVHWRVVVEPLGGI